LLETEAESAVAKGSSVAPRSSEDSPTESQPAPVLVIGTGKPLDYEAALAVHREIRSRGLGAVQVPIPDAG
jgi:hypothetical protein